MTSFLDLIEEDGRIEVRKENGISIIKIVGYERFSPPAGYFAKGIRRTNSNTMGDEMMGETQSQMNDDMKNPVHSLQLGDMAGEVQNGIPSNSIILESV